MEILKQFDLFKNLSDKEISEISRDLTFEQFVKGEVIISMAGPGKNIHLLIKGKASLIATGKSGRNILLEKLLPGEIFGERTYLGKNTINDYNMAVAEEESHVLTVPAEYLKIYSNRYPQFSYNLAELLAKRVVKLDRQLIEAEEDKKDLYEIVRQKDTEVNLPYQRHINTRFYKNHEQKIKLLAESSESFLISGESGVGKYQLGRMIFRLSTIFNRIFLVVNFYNPETFQMEGIDELLTAEQILFGLKTDNFYYPGLVELAREGTLLLIGLEKLEKTVQKKLFFLVTEQKFKRPGEDGIFNAALRILACSRKNLKVLETEKHIIPPLIKYFSNRCIHIPPLCERKKDVPVLVDFYVSKYSTEMGKHISPLPEMTLKVLLDHVWPGNDAELAETIKRGIVLSERGILRPENIHLDYKRIEDKGKFDLLKIPIIYNILKSPFFPAAIQWTVAPFFFILVIFLLLGPSDPEKNIGSIYAWALGWPMMVIGSFLWARFWCTICPMGTTGTVAKKIIAFNLPLPHIFKKYSNWVIMLMAISVLWIEMITEMRYYPFKLGILLVCFISGSIIFSVLFERETWCSYICGLGGMMGFFAKVSPIE